MSFRKASLAAGAALLLSGCYVYEGEGYGHGRGHGHGHGGPRGHLSLEIPIAPMTVAPSPGVSVTLRFTDPDIRVIRGYYVEEHHRGRGRHGHHDDDDLPPGIRKQIRRGQGLPPGLRYRSVPQELERQLRPLPSGYAWVTLGSDVAILDVRTSVVVDILGGN
ncbi:MAG: hypothetical protein OEW11_00700 [Nitrospirota bacterium]|nr:hypothetical protein [Nitrospirota bacterium]